MLYHRLIEEHIDDKRVVLSDGQTEMTFQQMHERAAQYCAVFHRMKLERGDRVLVMSVDLPETVIILLACIADGMIFVPVNQRLDQESKEYIIRDCKPALILEASDGCMCTAGGVHAKMKAAVSIKECAYERAGAAADEYAYVGEGISRADIMAERKMCQEDTLAYILYTSGTEGKSKGVVASHKQILFCSTAINRRLCNTAEDRILCCLPLSFDYGLYQVFLAFLSGARLYLAMGDVIQRIPYLLRHWEITAFPTIPSVANIMMKTGMLRDEDYPKLRYITFTGEILQVSLIRSLEERFPGIRVIPMYGLTECKRVSVMPEGREDKVRAGSCGLPLEGVRVWLERVEPDSGMGELVVEGENVMEGYWGMEDDSDITFSLNKETGKRRLHTGDIFRIDDEGFLYFCGRENGIIKVWGHRISSVWMENIIKTIEGVREAAVLSVADVDAGEMPVLFLYTSEEVTERHIQNRMRELPVYLQRYQLFMMKEPLPKNQNGKIDWKRLRETAESWVNE